MNNTMGDFQAGRDPFASSYQTGSGPNYYRRFANWSLLLPIIAILFSKGVESALKGVEGPVARLAGLGVAGLFMFLILGSLAFALVAFTGIPRNGTEGILVRASAGMALSLILLGIFGTGFYRGWQNAMSFRSVIASSKKLQADTKKDLESGHGISLDKQQARINILKQQVDSASQNASGNAALVAKATSAYIGRFQLVMKDYSVAAKALQHPPVLSMKGVERRQQLEAKKELAKQFMAANEKFLAFISNAENVYLEELDKQPLSPGEREQALRGFHTAFGRKQKLLIEIRDDDRRIGSAMLGMLDILDRSWGKWAYSAERKKVLFTQKTELDQYSTDQKEMDAAARDQQQFQMQLVSGRD